MSEGGWFDQEAIDAERFDADMEQAQFEAEGRERGRRHRRSEKLRAAGRFEDAARACPHGGGYPLKSIAGDRDVRAGEPGVRCEDCGSVLSAFPWDDPNYTVLAACETGYRRQ